MKKITWRQINRQNIPDGSGIYAWYYDVKIGERDVAEFIDLLGSQKSDIEKRKCIKEFLLHHIFHYYEETPYFATLAGKLKASYEGSLWHKQDVSNNLIDRLIKKPELIYDIRNMLQQSSFDFASPLYIGMARSLVSRLQKHKALIEKYRSEGVPRNYLASDEEARTDHNFAERICDKNFVETQLYVLIKEVETQNSLHNMLENILNRINYPILGRN